MEPWQLNSGNFTGISGILVVPVGPSHLVPTLQGSAQFYEHQKHLLTKNTQPRFQLRCCTGKEMWGSPKAARYAHKVKGGSAGEAPGAGRGAEGAVRGADRNTGAVRGAERPRTQRSSPSRLGTPALGITWMKGNPATS